MSFKNQAVLHYKKLSHLPKSYSGSPDLGTSLFLEKGYCREMPQFPNRIPGDSVLGDTRNHWAPSERLGGSLNTQWLDHGPRPPHQSITTRPPLLAAFLPSSLSSSPPPLRSGSLISAERNLRSPGLWDARHSRRPRRGSSSDLLSDLSGLSAQQRQQSTE